ncbi:hypothetical protein K504DRAFT_450068 [Pleomassaria siparia CBS 279.74]|uniref:C3H1-type domain-containing protein n=1 Tax=Pleomassaria siparia CBS 279.74 TaxID=1314801 RepID=A0A6G1KLU0_9PLEO|nr:hypothetical protein K504DRAFT_450068 [Pleomassaria siparia CBS 279.74]
MLLEDEDLDNFKQWMIPRLDAISEADPGVLAEYVIALVMADEFEDVVKKNCIDSLGDFLEDPKPFVEDVMHAIKSRSFVPQFEFKVKGIGKEIAEELYKPIPVAPIESTPGHDFGAPAAKRFPAQHIPSQRSHPPPTLSAEATIFNPPSGPAASKPPTHLRDRPTAPSSHGFSNALQNTFQSGTGNGIKRKLNDQDPGLQRGGRPSKLPAWVPRNNVQYPPGSMPAPQILPGTWNPVAPSAYAPAMSMPPIGAPPTNSMSPFMALAALGRQFPELLSMPFSGLPFPAGIDGMNGTRPPAIAQRCKNYDTKGFCVLGSVCPYEHGEEVVMPNFATEYDLKNASLAVQPPKAANGHRGLDGSQACSDIGSKSRPTGGRARAPFSQPGPTTDPENVAVVVEQIPEENFNMDAIRKFFSQFGPLASVELQSLKRLAIVRYDEHAAALRAYNSPKVIFDNRFVKVYWYNANPSPPDPFNGPNGASDSSSPANGQDEEILDPEEIKERQAEAQKLFEERQKKLQETTTKIESVQEQIQAKEAEIMEMRKKLAMKNGVDFVAESGPQMGDTQLMDQLKSLQAEAQDLGLKTNQGYRGRGAASFALRGRGSFRGGSRGRGLAGALYSGGRSAVKRLDNRPKRLAVKGIESGSAKDEALRQYLLATFKERYMAEVFLDDSLNIPDVGTLELSWVANELSPSSKTKPASSAQSGPNSGIKMDEAIESTEANNDNDAKFNINGDDDYDVAGDVDEWL